MQSLLEAIYGKYGYDFRHYSEAHIHRRITNHLHAFGYKSVLEMQDNVIGNRRAADELLRDLSITVTEMFRDPNFYRAIREKIIPVLKTYSFIKIWHAGCSTGEEAYSMAIILKEEDLYSRCTIYATDFNQHALNRAREGIFSSELIKAYTNNYLKAGGREAFSNYYTARYNSVIMDQSLKSNIVWANHNLVTDHVFAEVHLILCRNVLIYFNRDLQDRVQTIFYNSLVKGGILGLGIKESLHFSQFQDKYELLDKEQKLFKKKY